MSKEVEIIDATFEEKVEKDLTLTSDDKLGKAVEFISSSKAVVFASFIEEANTAYVATMPTFMGLMKGVEDRMATHELDGFRVREIGVVGFITKLRVESGAMEPILNSETRLGQEAFLELYKDKDLVGMDYSEGLDLMDEAFELIEETFMKMILQEMISHNG